MRICYLIGYPVEHSMSAVMHNAAFHELSLDYRYELLPVRPEELANLMTNRMRDLDVVGANVTIPHKVSIMIFLDWVEPEASQIGAVNTIVNENGRLLGYNTDGSGAMRSITDAYGALDGSKIVLLGAGGAARAIGYHLSTHAVELIILNRTLDHATSLALDLGSNSECKALIRGHGLKKRDILEALEDAHILINTTPVGMSPHICESLVDEELLDSNLFVFDIVYNPLKTKLLMDAENAGAKTLGGLKMLVYQGAAAFKLWTGLQAPEALMAHEAEKHLRVEKV
jgi:shikimate dehydrogenase